MRTNLIEKRKALGLKQYHIAKKLNCSPRQVRRYENGECEVPFDLAMLWAKKLKVSMNQFTILYKEER